MNQFEELKAAVRNGLAVQTHSGRVQPGDVFVALSGSREDGIRFIPEALANGAEFVVAARSDGWPAGASAQLIMHPDPRLALGELAAARFGTERLAFPPGGHHRDQRQNHHLLSVGAPVPRERTESRSPRHRQLSLARCGDSRPP